MSKSDELIQLINEDFIDKVFDVITRYNISGKGNYLNKFKLIKYDLIKCFDLKDIVIKEVAGGRYNGIYDKGIVTIELPIEGLATNRYGTNSFVRLLEVLFHEISHHRRKISSKNYFNFSNLIKIDSLTLDPHKIQYYLQEIEKEPMLLSTALEIGRSGKSINEIIKWSNSKIENLPINVLYLDLKSFICKYLNITDIDDSDLGYFLMSYIILRISEKDPMKDALVIKYNKNLDKFIYKLRKYYSKIKSYLIKYGLLVESKAVNPFSRQSTWL